MSIADRSPTSRSSAGRVVATRPRPVIRAAVLAAALLAGASAAAQAQPAAAPAAAVAFDLPAQPLGAALNELARQAGLQMSYPAAQVAGRSAPAVAGRMTVGQALERLLAGSGLRADIAGQTVVVEPAAATANEVLPAITVRAQAAQQTARGSRSGDQLVSPVVNAGILGDRSALETPFSIQSYTRDVIEGQQSRTLTEALRNDASARNIQNAGGYSSAVSIRGFDTYGANWDGLAGGFANAYQDFPLEFVDAVEVLKGPSAILFGSSNPSGSPVGLVNFVPKRAPRSASAPIRRLSVGVQTGGAVSASADLGGRAGPQGSVGWRVNLLGKKGGLAVDDVEIDEKGVLASFDWRATPALTLTADLGAIRSAKRGYTDLYALDAGVSLPRVPQARTNASMPWAAWSADRDFALLKADWRLDDAWRVELATTRTWSSFEYLSAGLVRITDALGNGTLETGVAKPFTVDTATHKATLFGRLDTGPVRHELAFSVSRDTEKGTYTPGQLYGSFATNIYRPVPVPRPVPLDSGTGAITYTDLTADTVRVVDAASFGDFTVVAGFGRVSIEDRIGAYDRSRTTPLLAALYRVRPDLSVYASYAEGLEKGGTAPAGTVNQNQTLPPKVSEQWELGVKQEWGRLLLSAAAFRIDRALEYTDPSTNRFMQDGQQRHTGLELSLSGYATDDLNVIVSALLMRPTVHNDTVDGNDPPGVPERAVSLYASYRLPAYRPLALSAGVQYKSSQWLDAVNSQRMAGYTVVDLGATLDMKLAWGQPGKLRLAVDNAADRSYWSTVSYGGFGIGKGEPRTVKLSATFDLE
jgi:iron complex outermembrane receptor protein